MTQEQWRIRINPTANDVATDDIRRANLEASAWRYFDASRSEFAKRHPNKVRRFPWLAFVWIAAGIGLVVAFGDKLTGVLGR